MTMNVHPKSATPKKKICIKHWRKKKRTFYIQFNSFIFWKKIETPKIISHHHTHTQCTSYSIKTLEIFVVFFYFRFWNITGGILYILLLLMLKTKFDLFARLMMMMNLFKIFFFVVVVVVSFIVNQWFF